MTFNYDQYTWTHHALKNLNERIGPMTKKEGDRMLAGAVRLSKKQRKLVRKQSPMNSSIYMRGTFKGRYFVMVANRYVFVICQPATVITCWDTQSKINQEKEKL